MALVQINESGSTRCTGRATGRRAVALGGAPRADPVAWPVDGAFPHHRQRFFPSPDCRLGDDPRHDCLIVDVPRRLWRHGQSRADDRAGVAGYMIAVLGTSSLPKVSLFWPWFVPHRWRSSLRLLSGRCRGAVRTHRRHLYDHDHLGAGERLLLLTLQNWPIFNGFNGFTTDSCAAIFWRRTGRTRSRSTI